MDLWRQTSLWALTTVCSQRGENWLTTDLQKIMKTSGRGGFQSHVYYWRAECWACGSAFANNMILSIFILAFFFIKSHPKFLPTHPNNHDFIGISAKKHFQLQLLSHPFKVKFHWFQASHSFPLSSNCSWTGHIFPRTRASWSMDHMTNWSFCDLHRFMTCKTDRNEIGGKQ